MTTAELRAWTQRNTALCAEPLPTPAPTEQDAALSRIVGDCLATNAWLPHLAVGVFAAVAGMREDVAA
jgi:hypothetical protein